MNSSIVVIIQARMGSTRLPGKVLKKLSNKTVLEQVVERVARSCHHVKIVIATTSKKEDDILQKEAERIGALWFRGSEDDVLERYYRAAEQYKADLIVRITSDCPLIDYRIMDSMIEAYLQDPSMDYLSNTVERTFPRGLDVEIFRYGLLEKAFYDAKENYQREHVTPYIWKNPHLFKICQFKNAKDSSDLRWTLDTEEDFRLISEIYKTLDNGHDYFGYNEIIKQYPFHPEWMTINAHIEQKKVQ